jgi:outer membrane protein OmpA-like peptidoglycan-associated protein
MGAPINSKEDDFSISWSLNSDFGYFSSNRGGQGPNDDVFYFSKNELEKKDSLTSTADSTLIAGALEESIKAKSVTLKGRVFNSDDNSPLAGQALLLVNLQSGESISIKTDENGNYQVGNLKQEVDYELTTLKVNCGDVKKQFNTFFQNESSEMIVDIPVYCLDDVIILRNIYYDYDKWEIRDDAALELNKLAELMRVYPSMKIELSSHTDARGDDLYNYALSRNRANSAVDYLISLGIDSSRLVAKGYGESRLLNRCGNGEECTEMEHEENRRTEFKILYIESNNPMNTSGMTITR